MHVCKWFAMELDCHTFFQLKSSGKSVDQNEILAEIKARDERDQSRAIAPLEKAADAHYVDTDKLDFEQVLEKVSQVLGPKLELERG